MEAQIKIYVTDYRSASSADATSENIEGLGKVAAGERGLARTRCERECWEGLCAGGSISKDCMRERALGRRHGTSDSTGRRSTATGVHNARALGNRK